MIEKELLKISEISISESPLLKEAQNMKNKEVNISKLDEPVVKDKIQLDSETEKRLEEVGMSKNSINSCYRNEGNDTIQLKTINDSLVGQFHSETGVFYEKRVVQIENFKIEGTFPKFDAKYETTLSKENLSSSDNQQFKECNKNLLQDIQKDEKLKNSFTKEQLEQIENGDTPRGYTWHHNEEVGKMQLVDTSIHNKTAHTGGKAIWGGGRENR